MPEKTTPFGESAFPNCHFFGALEKGYKHFKKLPRLGMGNLGGWKQGGKSMKVYERP